MGPTRLSRPPAPSAAERARSLVARGGVASLLGVRSPATRPAVHHVWANGSAVLLVADDDPEVFRALGRHLPPSLRDARARPLGVDRCGFRLRVETDHGDHDVRLAWGRKVTTPTDLCAALTDKMSAYGTADA